MGRKRTYPTAADRLKAFRLRKKVEQPEKSQGPAKVKAPSRPARLLFVNRELRALLDEYQQWRDNLPEPFLESDLAQKLDETIEQLAEATELLEEIDLPKGFGRD